MSGLLAIDQVAERIEIRLDGPLRGKGAGRAFNTRFGPRIFTDDKTRKYEAQLRYAAQQVMGDRAPLDGPLAVRVVARFQIPTTFSNRKRQQALAGHLRPVIRPDCENIAKVLDALNGVVWVDDKQIVVETIYKVYSNSPSLSLTIEPIALLAPRVHTVKDLFQPEQRPSVS